MTARTLIALLGGTLLTACNLAPKYDRPGAPIPAALPAGGVYPAAPSDAADVTAIGWRDFFTDARLRDTIALALENNRDLRLAAANVLAARAQYRVQRADILPSIGATGSATYTNNIVGLGGGAGAGAGAGGGAANVGDIQFYSANIGLSAFEIDLFGRIRNLTRAAQEQYFASTEGERAARIALIGEVANAWLTLAADRDQLRLSRETLTTYEKTLELTRARFRIGVASELEAKQTEALYQAARNDIAVLETRIAQDRNALELLTGASVPEAVLPTGLAEAPATRDALPAGLPSDILLRRPDVLQAEHQLIAQNANIGAARAAFFPRLSLTATLGTISTALSGLFGAGTGTYTVAPQATLPIFDAGRNVANVRLAEAQRSAAVATYEKTIQTAFREVADALAQRGTIGEQVSAQRARADAAAVAARLSDARYRAGVDSFLTALDAERTRYAAQQQLVTTRLAQATNLVTLYRTLGGGLAGPQ